MRTDPTAPTRLLQPLCPLPHPLPPILTQPSNPPEKPSCKFPQLCVMLNHVSELLFHINFSTGRPRGRGPGHGLVR